jgi:hypothetical protein
MDREKLVDEIVQDYGSLFADSDKDDFKRDLLLLAIRVERETLEKATEHFKKFGLRASSSELRRRASEVK